jgi:hypothetical protein
MRLGLRLVLTVLLHGWFTISDDELHGLPRVVSLPLDCYEIYCLDYIKAPIGKNYGWTT